MKCTIAAVGNFDERLRNRLFSAQPETIIFRLSEFANNPPCEKEAWQNKRCGKQKSKIAIVLHNPNCSACKNHRRE